MRNSSRFVLFLASLALLATAAAAQQIPLSRVSSFYEFEETSGTVFADSGAHGVAAEYYRPLQFSELPPLDVSNVSSFGMVGNAVNLGTRYIGDADQQVMIRIPASAALPAADDSFAVSFWLNSGDFAAAYGLLASYNLNGLEWSIGLHNTSKGITAWSGGAGETGTATYVVDCSAGGVGLLGGSFAHFIVQFEGTAGITNVYVNGASAPDSADNNFWGNEREGFVIGGRVLDARPYNVCNKEPVMDDFAIINGVLDATDVANLYSFGAEGFGSRRLAHYTMDEVLGSQISDSSSNANHGTLVAYNPATMGLAVRDLATASRPGVFGNSVELANGVAPQHARLASAEHLPTGGEDFTVCFWLKPDENLADLYGWDNNGVVASWSNGDLGFSVGIDTRWNGSLLVRRTTGDYTSPDNQDTYCISLGPDYTSSGTTIPGLNLDPTVFHHFAVTVDTDGKITAIYVDGTYVASQYANGWGVSDETTAVLGCRIKNGAADSGICGYIDDLAIIRGVLSETQIAKAMATGVKSLIGSTPGDINEDGVVDAVDASILAATWRAQNATPEMGDINRDTIVDDLDASILAANWVWTSGGAASVPEPSLVVLLAGAAVALGVSRGRRGGSRQ